MRPILLGMNNPLSSDPRHALFPHPPGCAGHRLWAMLHAVSGAPRQRYLDGFDRRNLVTGPWTSAKARIAAGDFTSPLTPGTIVVVLGLETARALGLVPQPGNIVAPFARAGVTYRVVPHPSGRNLWYNRPEHRLAVGLLLEELLHVGD